MTAPTLRAGDEGKELLAEVGDIGLGFIGGKVPVLGPALLFYRWRRACLRRARARARAAAEALANEAGAVLAGVLGWPEHRSVELRRSQRLFVRPYVATDRLTALDLVNAVRPPDQPRLTFERFVASLADQIPDDREWWAVLQPMTADVVTGGKGDVRGLVVYTAQAIGDEGLVLWLGCRDEAAEHTLRHHVNERLSPRTVRFLGEPVEDQA